MLIEGGSLGLLVHVMVLGVEKSHIVFAEGVWIKMAKADEQRLRAARVNE
jgi:hypothetical protein